MNPLVRHILHIVAKFYKNAMLVTRSRYFMPLINAYTCTFSNNLSFVWYFNFWAHSLVGLVTKKSMSGKKKNCQCTLTL